MHNTTDCVVHVKRLSSLCALSAITGTGHISSAGWTYSTAVLKLSVCLCVNQAVINHNHYT